MTGDDLDGYFERYDAGAWLRRAEDVAADGRCVLVGESCPRCYLAVPSWPRMVAARGQRYCVCPRLEGDPVTVDVLRDLMPRHGLGRLSGMFAPQAVARSPIA